MKNISSVLNIVFAVAIAVLFYLHFSTPQATRLDSSKATNPNTAVMPKIELKSSPLVYINADSLWENYVVVKQMRKELEIEKNKFEKKFEADYHKLESDYLDLRDKAATLTEEEGMKRQQELMLREQKLTEYRQSELERLSKLEDGQSEKIQKTITQYLNDHYGKSNYAFILGYSAHGGILYANDSLEITSEVINGLNADIKK